MLNEQPQSFSQTAHQVIAVRGSFSRWIEPWYGAYAILGALASETRLLQFKATFQFPAWKPPW